MLIVGHCEPTAADARQSLNLMIVSELLLKILQARQLDLSFEIGC